MKKILFWSVVTIMAAVSCNKELEKLPAADENLRSFVASVEGADTKTLIDGVKTYWNGTEQIRVFDGTISKVFEAAGVVKAETAEFTEVNTDDVLAAADYMAIYPANTAGSVTWDGNVENPLKKMWLSDQQNNIVEGSYAAEAHVAVAYAEEGADKLAFKNVVSLLKFTVNSDNVNLVSIYSRNSDAMVGNFDITYNGGNPTVNTQGEGYYTPSWVKAEGNFVKGQTYYFAVLPTTLSEGFGVCLNETYVIREAKREVTFERNVIYDLGTFEIPEAQEYNWGIIGMNGNWDTDVDMTLEGDWYVAKSIVLTTSDEFKFRADDGWTINRGGISEAVVSDKEYSVSQGGNDMKVAVSAVYDVYLYKDASKMKIVKVGDYNEEEVKWYMVGSFNEWDPCDDEYIMTLSGDYYVYQGLDMAANAEIKFTNGSWGTDRGGTFTAVNTAVALSSPGDNIVVTAAGIYDIYVAADGSVAYFMEQGKTPADVEPKWGLVGYFNDWASDLVMEKDGTVWSVKNVALEAGKGWKLRLGGKWDVNMGASGNVETFEVPVGESLKVVSGGKNLTVPTTGNYDIYFDESNDMLYVMTAGTPLPEA